MKKAFLVFGLIFSISFTQAQEKETNIIEEKQDELKINMTKFNYF